MRRLDGSELKKKSVKLHLVCIFLIFVISIFSTYVNSVDEGYIVSGADYPFIQDIQHHAQDLGYVWSSAGRGEGSSERIISAVFRYYTSLFLDKLGFSDSFKVNFFFFAFVFLSAMSIYFALGFFVNFKVNPLALLSIALFYSFNSFTIDGFRSSTLYHSLYDLYIFLPLIWSFFLRGIIDSKTKYLIFSGFFVLLSVSGFSNPAFLISLFLFLGLNILVCYFLRLVKAKSLLIMPLVFLFFITIMSFYTLPLVYELRSGSPYKGMAEEMAVQDVIRTASSQQKLSNIARLQIADPDYSFPNYFPYLSGNSFAKNAFILFSYAPFLFVVFALIFVRDDKKKFVILFGILWALFFFATAKAAVPIIGEVSVAIFSKSLLKTLRNPDKTLIFVPFIYGVMIFFLLRSLLPHKSKLVADVDKYQRIKRGLFVVIFATIVLYPLPFFLGKFQENVFSLETRNTKYNFRVKVPADYRKMANFINKDKGAFKIMHMPFGGRGGRPYSGWLAFDKWNYLGSDTVKYLFRNPVIQPTYRIGYFDYGEYLQNRPDKKDYFVYLSRQFGVRYLIVDDNVGSRYIDPFQIMIKRYDLDNDFKYVTRFGGLKLYKIRSDKELPVLYTVPSISRENDSITNRTNASLKYYSTLLVGDWYAISSISDISRTSENSIYFLSKMFDAKDPLSLIKLADRIIFYEGNILELALDLMPESVTKKNFVKIPPRHNEKSISVNIPSKDNYEVYIKLSSIPGIDGSTAVRIDGKELQKVVLPTSSYDEKIFKERWKDMRDGPWQYGGSINLTKGTHSLKVDRKVSEVKILKREEIDKLLMRVNNLLADKDVSILVHKEESDYSPNYMGYELIDVKKSKNNTPNMAPTISDFSRVNSTKLIADLKSTPNNRAFWLVFSESFHKGWKVYYGKINWWQALWQKPIPEDKHFLVNGYANAWHIDNSRSREITLYFWPQSLFYIGLIISGLTLFGCIGYLGRDLYRNREI